MGKIKAIKTIFSKLTKKQRDLRNARSRAISYANRPKSRLHKDLGTARHPRPYGHSYLDNFAYV